MKGQSQEYNEFDRLFKDDRDYGTAETLTLRL